jgi:hypothetical protein
MPYSTKKIEKKLKGEYKMDCEAYPLGHDVVFFGSELDCYKLAYRLKSKESKVFYSENLKIWGISFPYFFSVEFSQKIDNV